MFVPLQNSYVETVLPNVMVFEGGAFEGGEVVRVRLGHGSGTLISDDGINTL